MLTNDLEELEERISKELKWGKVEDIPNFPLNSFYSLQQEVKESRFLVGIEPDISLELAPWFYGFFVVILGATPFIGVITSIVLSFIFSNYWLLFGVILSILAFLLSNPYNFAIKFWKIVTFILFILFLYNLWHGQETITFLIAFFIYPFFINSYSRSIYQNKLKSIALKHEKIFIYIYLRDRLILINSSNGQEYRYK
jgi:hypothetical protein